LLDFGLAKLTQAAPSSGDAETHTIQSEAGTVLGTVGYMSPEQIRGKLVRRRFPSNILSEHCQPPYVIDLRDSPT
jgi:serine/threonine protein kinase